MGHLNKISNGNGCPSVEPECAHRKPKKSDVDDLVSTPDNADTDPLPPGWEMLWDAYEEAHYFYNASTGTSSWYRPAAPPSAPPGSDPEEVISAHQTSPPDRFQHKDEQSSPSGSSNRDISNSALVCEAHQRGGDVSHTISSDSDSDCG